MPGSRLPVDPFATAAPPEPLPLYGAAGRALGLPGFVLVAVVVVLLAWRPTGGGQIASLARAIGGEGEDPNVSLGVLAVELLAIVVFLLGVVATVAARAVAAVDGAGITLAGIVAVAIQLLGLGLWGAAWVAEGLSVTASNPWREG